MSRLLGQGGMGVVYCAVDEVLLCEVALKMIATELGGSAGALARLRDEVRLAQKVTHANVCRTYDLEEVDGQLLIKMEYVSGETLAERLKRGSLPVAEVVRIAVEVCAGLAAAHAQDVVHLDLKPHNIMLEADTGRVVLMDFGIARVMREAARGVSGTPDYMAPEQMRGLAVDARTDLYALGCVMYEMLVGERLFPRDTAQVTALPRRLPKGLGRLIARLLDKEPAGRPASAAEVAATLVAGPRRRIALGAALLAVAILVVLVGRSWHDAARARWARQVATPEVDRLVEADEYVKAAALAREALAVLPGDVTLERLWKRSTFEISVDSTPAGAEVSYRPYGSSPGTWSSLGTTPVSSVRIPRDRYVWQVTKPGLLPAWQVLPRMGPSVRPSWSLSFALVPAEGVPPDMVSIPKADPIFVPENFLLDRFEVTNADYQRFVDAGGYRRAELWKEPFVRDGRPIPWQDAVVGFVDASGRPGPSTWAQGHFPEGQGAHPVSGVSWYEASAYAAFVGKTLPTIHHWYEAAQTSFSGYAFRGSNFGPTGTVPVGGEGALSGYGTYDLAGNVKEWCLNQSQAGTRFVAGGGFGEPTYSFGAEDSRSPWSREPNIGFRCVKLPGPPTPAAAEAIKQVVREFRDQKPVSDEVFRAYQSQFTYDRTELNARVESRDETVDWTCERVSFDAAYGGERVFAYVYLPRSARPPYQTVLYWPAGDAFSRETFELLMYLDFIPKTGRAFVAPVLKGTYERHIRDDLGRSGPLAERELLIAQSKDVGRTLDYLETRSDIDQGRLAYLGLSTTDAPVILAVETRFKAAVIIGGGLAWGGPAEVDPMNFIGRVHLPVLMLNGVDDSLEPVETSQRPMFELLGTPAEHKKHIVYDGGHVPPRKDVIRDCLGWLDAYLGPVARER